MRLVFVSHSQPPSNRPLSNTGGMQRVAQELFSALVNRSEGNPPTAIILKSSWRWVHLRIVPFLFRAYYRLKSLAGSGEVDTILFSSMVTATLLIPLERVLASKGIKSAVIVHGKDVTTPFGPYQRVVRRIFGIADIVFPVSGATAEVCVERGLSRDRIQVVHNGVDITRFAALSSPTVARKVMIDALSDRSHELTDTSFLLCSVGRQVRRKGFAWFIDRVMPDLPENVHYWLAGDGPEEESIRQAIDRHGLHGRIRLLGKVTDIELQAIYRGADLFVMPNIPVAGDMEGFGIVMLEAGLNGLPTVAARLEGIREVIREGENGWFVESGDAPGFVAAIQDVIAHPDDRPLARTRAREYTVRTFGWEQTVERYLEVLSELA